MSLFCLVMLVVFNRVFNFFFGVGTIFYGQAHAESPLYTHAIPDASVANVTSLLFFGLMFTLISNVQAIPYLCSRNQLYRRELAAYSYCAAPYWLSQCLIPLPFQLINQFVFTLISYFMCKFPLDASYFWYFIFVLFQSNMCSYYFAMFLAAWLNNESLAFIGFPIIFLALAIFCGYAITLDDIPVYWNWVPWFNYARWAFEGLMVNEWGRFETDDYIIAIHGNGDVLALYGFEDFNKNDTFWILTLNIVLTTFAIYYAMWPAWNKLTKVSNALMIGTNELRPAVSTDIPVAPGDLNSPVAFPPSAAGVGAYSHSPPEDNDHEYWGDRLSSMLMAPVSSAVVAVAAVATGRKSMVSGTSSGLLRGTMSSNSTPPVGTPGGNRKSSSLNADMGMSVHKNNEFGMEENDDNADSYNDYDDGDEDEEDASGGGGGMRPSKYGGGGGGGGRKGRRRRGTGSGSGSGNPSAGSGSSMPTFGYRSTLGLGDFAAASEGVARPVSCALTFRDVHYTVADTSDRTKKIRILDNAYGRVEPGELCALMGASGAGKSTLLDVLANRKNTGELTGTVYINGLPRTQENMQNSAYVLQDNVHLALMTVQEAILYAAQLRLDESLPLQMKLERVNMIMKMLHLEEVKDTIAGNYWFRGISGGQLKRLSIAVEIVHLPSLLFLDEPTTGLDSAIAHEVMCAVRALADQHRTVVCTIHQPSTDTYNLFHKLLLLAGGKVIYFGSANKVTSFFAGQSGGFHVFQYKPGTNPADFAISVGGGYLHSTQGAEVSDVILSDQFIKSPLGKAFEEDVGKLLQEDLSENRRNMSALTELQRQKTAELVRNQVRTMNERAADSSPSPDSTATGTGTGTSSRNKFVSSCVSWLVSPWFLLLSSVFRHSAEEHRSVVYNTSFKNQLSVLVVRNYHRARKEYFLVLFAWFRFVVLIILRHLLSLFLLFFIFSY
jgi:ABC-type multidrug transport system ATPase subunit/ABC-type multidrug transport system permease subunit